MHIPDGFLDPKLSSGLAFAALAAVSFALNKAKEAVLEPAPRKVLAAVGRAASSIPEKAGNILSGFGRKYIIQVCFVSSLIFSMQMFDFPVIHGTTGHLMGGALAAILLGPFGGALSMTSALIVQAVFLRDGGLLALGANIMNMAFAGSFASYYIFSFLKKRIGFNISVMLSAWISVVLMALAYSLETGDFSSMLPLHAAIGIAEALFTLGVVRISRIAFDWKEAGCKECSL